MKKVLQLFLAGVLGGAVAFGAFKVFDKNTVIYEEIPAESYATSSSAPTSSEVITSNFVAAAQKANPAVVHISAQNNEYVQYSLFIFDAFLLYFLHHLLLLLCLSLFPPAFFSSLSLDQFMIN